MISILKKPRLAYAFPLLSRDLREQAARPRTWVIRITYALVFFAIVFWEMDEVLRFLESGLSVMNLGSGGQVFDRLMKWQLAGIALVMPVISAGAIAGERERDTLQLVLVTRLTARTLLWEKLLSRSFSMLSLVMLAFPLLAFAYSLGGVTRFQMIGSICLLLTTVLEVGAFALLWSAWASSTAAALGGIMVTGIPVFLIFGACVLPSAMSESLPGLWLAAAGMQLFFTWLLLALAHEALLSRAAVPARSLLAEFFGMMDVILDDLNQTFARGVVLIKDERQLPDSEPLAWLTMRSRSVNTKRFQIRLALALMICALPTLVIAPFEAYAKSDWSPSAVLAIACELNWIILMLVIATVVPATLSGQRSRQTIDSLLVSPMRSREIVQQSMAGIWRLTVLVSLPLLTVIVLRVCGSYFQWAAIRYAIGEACCLLTVVPFAVWVAMWIGLISRSPTKGILRMTLLIMGSITAGLLLFPNVEIEPVSNWTNWPPQRFLAFAFPSHVIRLNENQMLPLAVVLAYDAFLLGATLVLRRSCLNHADRLLDRA